MRTLVYAHRSQTERALALAASLRGPGNSVLYRDTRGYTGGVEPCDLCITDDPRVVAAHIKAGIPVRPFTEHAPVMVPVDIPKPVTQTHGGHVPEAPTVTTANPYRVEKNGTWFSLIGPDGKVGTSQRSEAAAWALAPKAGG